MCDSPYVAATVHLVFPIFWSKAFDISLCNKKEAVTPVFLTPETKLQHMLFMRIKTPSGKLSTIEEVTAVSDGEVSRGYLSVFPDTYEGEYKTFGYHYEVPKAGPIRAAEDAIWALAIYGNDAFNWSVGPHVVSASTALEQGLTVCQGNVFS
eukprot:2823181-Pyramimonas_sp.AAC.2